MSASGRFILLISGLSVAVYVMWPETGADMTVPPDQERQDDRGVKGGSGSLNKIFASLSGLLPGG